MRHDMELCDQSGEDQDKAWLDGPVLLFGTRRYRVSPPQFCLYCLPKVAKRIISEGTSNGCERGEIPRGGRQATLFNLLRCSSNLCHYQWNKRA